ncbi:MAG: glutamate racemase [Spirulina sp. SIO3F2]|nr:glutamate racemase [Spirulina sp. SIO3F2]
MRTRQSGSIGVFDSGVGGLTVLRTLQQCLPQESFLYFGDTARVPYGNRTPREIIQFGREIITWMLTQGVKMVVMACNTSSALALDEIRQEFPIPVLGLILPGAKAAVQQGDRIGVIATPATVQSDAYYRAITEINPQARVWQVGCPEFVPLIEGNQIHTAKTRTIVASYLNLLIEQEINTLVYGCTHYPHLAPIIEQLLPPTVRCVDPAGALSQAVVQELRVLGLGRAPGRPGQCRFVVSGKPNHFARVARQWRSDIQTVETVNVKKAYRMAPLLTKGELNSVDL